MWLADSQHVDLFSVTQWWLSSGSLICSDPNRTSAGLMKQVRAVTKSSPPWWMVGQPGCCGWRWGWLSFSLLPPPSCQDSVECTNIPVHRAEPLLVSACLFLFTDVCSSWCLLARTPLNVIVRRTFGFSCSRVLVSSPCDGQQSFINASSGGVLFWRWDFAHCFVVGANRELLS